MLNPAIWRCAMQWRTVFVTSSLALAAHQPGFYVGASPWIILLLCLSHKDAIVREPRNLTTFD